MLKVENLRKSYGRKIVLNGVDLKLDTGFYGLIGKNGAGKTTLLRCILGIEKYEGSIVVNDRPIEKLNRYEIARLIGYVPQISSQDLNLSVREFVEMGVYFRDGNVEEALSIIDVPEDRKINTLSGGEFQKVLIARAMAGNPPLLLLDEPASHLDIKNTGEIIRILKRYSYNHLVLAVIHDLYLLNYVDKIVVLHNGKARIYEAVDNIPLMEVYGGNLKIVEANGMRFPVPLV